MLLQTCTGAVKTKALWIRIVFKTLKLMPRETLLDNFTLQGAYGFVLSGKKGRLYEECLSSLVESIVIYDNVYVPNDVLQLNDACKEIAVALKE